MEIYKGSWLFTNKISFIWAVRLHFLDVDDNKTLSSKKKKSSLSWTQRPNKFGYPGIFSLSSLSCLTLPFFFNFVISIVYGHFYVQLEKIWEYFPHYIDKVA